MTTNKKRLALRYPASRKAMLLACAVGLWTAAPAGDAPPWPTEGWETTTPAEAGMQQSLLNEARNYALTGGGAGVVVRTGRLVYAWGNTGTRFDLKSTTKSIGVTALGLAVQDGLVSIGDDARAHLPGVGVPPQSNTGTGWLGDVTLLHLATHTAGFDKSGGFVNLLHEPGTVWSYSDAGANWLADVLTVRYGKDLNTVLFDRVFDPLGIRPADLTWRDNRYRGDQIEGIKRREFGAGIAADVDAMARIGYLYLRDGAWEGRRILPADFVAAASRPVPDVIGLPVTDMTEHAGASDHYGLLWWNNGDGSLANVPEDAYWAWGLKDGLIIIVPSLDLVVARAGNGWRQGWDSNYAVLKPFLEPIARAVDGVSLSRPPVVRIDSPADGISRPAGEPVSFEGGATDADDGGLAHALNWVSDRDGPIGAGADFVTSALSAGIHVITASVTDSGGLIGDTNVVLSITGDDAGNARPQVAITTPDDGESFTEGDSATFTGAAQDTEEGDLGGSLEWTSNRDGLLGSGSTLSVTTLTPGEHTITAEVSDSAGATGSDSVQLVIVTAGSGSTTSLPAIADTFANKGSPGANFGRKKIMRAHGPNDKKVIFLAFDLSQLGTAVSAATLSLHVKDVKKPGVLEVRAVLEDWSETGLTHSEMPGYGPVLASITLAAFDKGATVNLDVTGIVQQWSASPSSAHGLALTSNGLHGILSTRETANAPVIEIQQ